MQVDLLVADSDPVVHVGVTHMLAGLSWLTVTAHARSSRETMMIAEAARPDMILLGLRLPGALSSRLIGQLRGCAPGIKVVVFAPPLALDQAVTASADGIVPRAADSAILLDVVTRVAGGELVAGCPDHRLTSRRDHAGHGLTRREYDILCRVAMGETNAEVARALGLTTNTAKTYFQRTLEKLGARNRTEAVVYATELGLL
ncbi:MAG TPA: response regulator transcription factor [Streptosporangiaceae bacterium]|jgi:DNA-binding NarL/FixJ family response regulator